MMKCTNIELLRTILEERGWESIHKPNGQIKHTCKGCVCNTYNTGSVVVQGEHKKYEDDIERIVVGINNIGKVA